MRGPNDTLEEEVEGYVIRQKKNIFMAFYILPEICL